MTLFIAAVYTLITSSRVMATVRYPLTTVSLPLPVTVDGSEVCSGAVSGAVGASVGITKTSADVSLTGSVTEVVPASPFLHATSAQRDTDTASTAEIAFFNTVPPPVFFMTQSY